MKTINEYKNRFNQLLESTIGDVKPLIMEQTTTTATTSGSPLTLISDLGTFYENKFKLYQNKTNNKFYIYMVDRVDKQEKLHDDNDGKGYNTSKEAIEAFKSAFPDDQY